MSGQVWFCNRADRGVVACVRVLLVMWLCNARALARVVVRPVVLVIVLAVEHQGRTYFSARTSWKWILECGCPYSEEHSRRRKHEHAYTYKRT